MERSFDFKLQCKDIRMLAKLVDDKPSNEKCLIKNCGNDGVFKIAYSYKVKGTLEPIHKISSVCQGHFNTIVEINETI